MGIDKSGFHTKVRQGMSQQVVAATVDGLLCYDMTAICCQSLNRIGDGCSAGSNRESCRAPLQGCDALFEHILRRVGQAAIDVAGISQAKTVSRMLAVAEYIRSGLVNGYCPRIRCRVRLFLSYMQL